MGRAVAIALALLAGCERAESPQERSVEVQAVPAMIGGKDLTLPLTDETVAELGAHPDVARVVPRMFLRVPATVTLEAGGQQVRFQIGGFVDGVDPRYVGDPAFSGDDPLPVLVSPSLLEIYNQRFAGVYGYPPISDAELFFLGRNPPRITVEVGFETIQAKVVGISPKAMRLGVTVPIERVREWNGGTSEYSSIVVVLRDGRRVPAFESWLVERGLRLVSPW